LKNNPNSLFVFGLSIIAVVLIAAIIIFGLAGNLRRPSDDEKNFSIGFGSDTVRAEVLDIMEEGEVNLGSTTQNYQILLVKIQEGPFIGQLAEIDYGLRQIRPPGLTIRVGDMLLVTTTQMPDGSINAYFTDFIRGRSLLWLLCAFILFSVIISGWKGVRSIIGMAFSLTVVIVYIIPRILQGSDPVLVSISGAFLLLTVTLYLTYGWTMKTHAAVTGTLLSLLLTGFLAHYFIYLTRLTGFGSEDALFLAQQSHIQINLRGLVLGGMIIGALGVLDDLVITQASAVMEIYTTNPQQTFWALYRSAMRIGQDHVAATVNTLVLAYTGAALPTMLLFSLSGENFLYLVNLEFVTEEIVRTLVGSLGLIAAVPITTYLACLTAVHQKNLGKWRRFLGPVNGRHDSGHTH
jgi:uncharacterized membrane protein